MGNRWFNAVIELFWLCTMTWLLVAKVVPPLVIGEPPSYRSLYLEDGKQTDEPICWEMAWNDRPIGYAVSAVKRTESGVTEVKSWVHFRRVPLEEMAAPLFRALLRRVDKQFGPLRMDAESRLDIDPLGRLSMFRSTIHTSGEMEPVVIRGQVNGPTLRISIEAGKLDPIVRDLPATALVGDELAPQARLPDLHVGQRWTIPVYSPLRSPNSADPVEVLQATVEGYESVQIGDESRLAMAVVYRSDSGSILAGSRSPRGKLWVADDGTVLKQISYVLGSRLQFVRASPARAKEIVRAASRRWGTVEMEDEESSRVRLPGVDGKVEEGELKARQGSREN
jgi:hypothetical protein